MVDGRAPIGFVHHCLCLHILLFTAGGPVLTGFGIYFLVYSRTDPQAQEIGSARSVCHAAEFNANADIWQGEPVYGYDGYSHAAASVRLSIVQSSDASSVCPAAALALAPYTVALQGGADSLDVIPDAPSNLEAWQQWKLTSSWPAPSVSSTLESLAYQPGCALQADFFNGPASGSGASIATVQADMVTTMTYTLSDLQCSTSPSTTCSSANPTPASYSAGAAVTADVGAASIDGATVVKARSPATSTCKPSCTSVCSARFGTWNAATHTCTVQTALHALCARASPISAAQPQVYHENNTYPGSSNSAGCYVGANGFQPNQDVYLTNGSTASDSVSIILRSSQDPYLEYLALTGGNSFPLPASYYRTVGAILLAVGLALLLGMLSLLCCCCCLIRHAVRLKNGQPSGWATSTIYNTAQAYRIPPQYIYMQHPGQPQQQQGAPGYAPSAPNYEQAPSPMYPGQGYGQPGAQEYGLEQPYASQYPPRPWHAQESSGAYEQGQGSYPNAYQQEYRPQESPYSQPEQYGSVEMSQQTAIGYPAVYGQEFQGSPSAGPPYRPRAAPTYDQPKK